MSFLFGKTQKPTPVAAMPTPDDKDVQAAEDRQRKLIAARSGRASTMLSRQNSGDAGTSSYSNSLLGSGT